MSGPMVLRCLAEVAQPGAGKTVTRRLLKPAPGVFRLDTDDPAYGLKAGDECPVEALQMEGEPWPRIALGRVITRQEIRYRRGLRLWVREAWWIATRYSYGTTSGGSECPPPALAHRSGDPIHYAADGDPPNCANRHYGPDGLRGGYFAAPDPYATWMKTSSLHMPRWANRLTLEVTSLKVERLQDITDEEALREGVAPHPESGGYTVPGVQHPIKAHGILLSATPRGCFAALWDTLHGSGAWLSNPWVIAIGFRPMLCNIDKVPEP